MDCNPGLWATHTLSPSSWCFPTTAEDKIKSPGTVSHACNASAQEALAQHRLELAFYCSDKDHEQKQLGKKGLIWLTQPKSQLTEGSHGKTSHRHHGGVLLPGWLSTASSAFLYTYPLIHHCPGMEHCRQWAGLSTSIIIQECPTGLPTGHSNRSIFNSSSLFSDDSSLYQVENNETTSRHPISSKQRVSVHTIIHHSILWQLGNYLEKIIHKDSDI